MNKFLASTTLLMLAWTAQAQTTPAPYWQQEVNYSIDVALDDQQHMLTAKEELVYKNNSPATLHFIWFHLWPNAYRDNTTAFAKQQVRSGKLDFQFAKPAQRGYIDQLDFKVDGQAAKLEYDAENPDIAKLILPQPLAPGASITITTPFRVKLPDSFSRGGHVGQSYQITQWYPKPAVYDRTGWHHMPYLDQGEFYSEFGSFDVRITLPANYVVGATGELQNPDERLRMDQLAAEAASKKTAADFGTALTFPASSTDLKTLRYIQDRVHDFAWFADKRFNVLKDTVRLGSGRVVTTWNLFTNRSVGEWLSHRNDIRQALLGYSQWVGEYPYSAATAVDGALSAGSGMEYPMVTVTEPAAIIHEVGHNWFYGILASNERDQPWQDEGVNTYTETRVKAQKNGTTDSSALFQLKGVNVKFLNEIPKAALEQLQYQAPASRALDQPAGNFPSEDYSPLNYGLMVYQKTDFLLRYLAAYLGQDVFDQSMRAYYDQWKFRHPTPADMQAAFEQTSGKKLNWFFRDMLGTSNRYTASLSAIQVRKGVVKVLVRNDSPAPWAIPVATLDAQGKILETKWTPVFGGVPDSDEAVRDQNETQVNFKGKDVAAVVIDPTYQTLQLNRRDDRIKTAGAFKRLEPIRFSPLFNVERWDRASIDWLPVIGANTSDKFMLGAAFYNNALITRRLNYLAMPMYSFARGELNGIGRLDLNILPQKNVRHLVTSVNLERFERYRKFEPSITFFLPHQPFQGPQHILRLANTTVRDEDIHNTSSIQTLEYEGKGGNALQRWTAHVEFNQLTPDLDVENSAVQARLLRAAATYQRAYAPKRVVWVRLFGGRFLQSSTATPFLLGMSGSLDYRRQTTFLDRQQISRSLTAQAHQTDEQDGAFKAYLPVYSQRWLSSLNIEATLPVTQLRAFADLGLTEEQFTVAGGTQRAFYDAGLVLPLFKNILRFYLPIAGSQYSSGFPATRSDFTNNIRFVLRLDELNPFRQINQQLAH